MTAPNDVAALVGYLENLSGDASIIHQPGSGVFNHIQRYPELYAGKVIGLVPASALEASEAKAATQAATIAALQAEVERAKAGRRAMHRRAQAAEGVLRRLRTYLDLWVERLPVFTQKGRTEAMAELYMIWLTREDGTAARSASRKENTP